jgi:hypothetical protein
VVWAYLSLLRLPGRSATLFLVDDLVARPPVLLEERREMDAIDRREIVAHVSAIDFDDSTLLTMGKCQCFATPFWTPFRDVFN